MAYTYTAGKFTLTTTSTRTTLPGADGIVRIRDGSLVIRGEGTTWKVDPKTGAKQLLNPSGYVISDHVTYDSQKNVIWTSGDNPPPTLAKIPLTAFDSNTSGTPVQLKGDDTVVT